MLENIFISYHFDEEAIRIAEYVDRLIRSQNIKPVTGRRLAGQSLSTGVKKKIDDCQAIIVLLTKREQGKTNQWVTEERAYAEGKGLEIMTLIEDEIKEYGMFKSNERIKLDFQNLHLNLLDLSETIGLWKAINGVQRKLLLRPKNISSKIANDIDQYPIRYRIWTKNNYSNNTPPNWKNISSTPTEGGATIFLSGVRDEDLVEVEVNIDGVRWASAAANHNIIVELNQK